jgi:hypothetical protein
MVMDVNDEAPRFRSPSYVCEVSEGAQANSPLTFLGNAKPEVFDHDQVSAMIHLHDQRTPTAKQLTCSRPPRTKSFYTECSLNLFFCVFCLGK